ncbi:MAG: flagellar biosynthesis protein FlhB [Clostridiaceae bacterium]|jgi:flagellar biosynthetic protein FlhB|nr:flagellar biosynthesis protein FlhB [Clostridiaceae bacterium]
MAGEKTEKATLKKRRDAKKEGDVHKSIEVSNAFSLLVITLLVGVYLSHAGTSLVLFLQSSLYITEIEVVFDFRKYLKLFFDTAGVFMIALLAMGLLTNYMQVGFLFTSKKLKPDLKKMNPIEGLKRIFSKKTLFELFKNLGKMALIILLSYSALNKAMLEFSYLSFYEILPALHKALSVMISILTSILIGLATLAVIDFIYQWFDYEKKMKMTKQEVKDEFKNTEGDPQIKSFIKSRQRMIARRRMMHAVPTADAIITNPTHIAIAIKYKHKKDTAPIVVAKGQGLIAEKIKQIAKENNIYIVENKPLARILFKKAEIGDFIPYEHYKAVAEILAYVYNIKNKKEQGDQN